METKIAQQFGTEQGGEADPAVAPMGVVSSGPVSAVRRHDTPLDSGCGYEDEREQALIAAKREALGRLSIPPGCWVEFTTPVPYSGTEPLVQAVVRHPGSSDFAARPVDV